MDKLDAPSLQPAPNNLGHFKNVNHSVGSKFCVDGRLSIENAGDYLYVRTIAGQTIIHVNAGSAASSDSCIARAVRHTAAMRAVTEFDRVSSNDDIIEVSSNTLCGAEIPPAPHHVPNELHIADDKVELNRIPLLCQLAPHQWMRYLDFIANSDEVGH